MKDNRRLDIANYIVDHKCTIREAAKEFGISKSTVFRDISILREQGLSKEVDKVLEVNKNERNMRGGLATQRKLLALKEQSKC